jgi:hypothetical protein
LENYYTCTSRYSFHRVEKELSTGDFLLVSIQGGPGEGGEAKGGE